MNSTNIKDISKIYNEQVAVYGLNEETKEERYKRLSARSITPAQRKAQERSRKGREVLDDIQATERALKAKQTPPKETPKFDTPDAEVRVLKPGQKKDTLALKAKKAMKESNLDPVGKEDSDIDNDGDVDKSDSYLKHRRKVRTRSIKKESFSNWRQDLVEVIDDMEGNDITVNRRKKSGEVKITEKKVKNTVKINPNLNLGEAVNEIGGDVLDVVEIDECFDIFEDFTDSEVFFLNDNLIEDIVYEIFEEYFAEGYSIDDIENGLIEAIEVYDFALNEANVTYGHDTSVKKDRLQRVKGAVKKVSHKAGELVGKTVKAFKSGYESGRGASSTQSSNASSKPGLLSRVGSKLKSGLKNAVARGARKVASHANKIADRVSDKKADAPSKVHSKSGVRSQNTYRGAGVGSKERVGSPKPQSSAITAKKTTVKSSTAKPKAKAKAKTSSKKSKSSRLDDLLTSIRSEGYQLDEKVLSTAEQKKKEELVLKMKKNLSGFEKRYPGRGKDVLYATATKMAKKIA